MEGHWYEFESWPPPGLSGGPKNNTGWPVSRIHSDSNALVSLSPTAGLADRRDEQISTSDILDRSTTALCAPGRMFAPTE